MREWQEWYREGTDMGPVKWDHPKIAEATREERFCGTITLETLKEVEAHPERFTVTEHQCTHDVFKFAMYDGWPYWEQRPAFRVSGPLGPEWIWLDDGVAVRRKEVRAVEVPKTVVDCCFDCHRPLSEGMHGYLVCYFGG